MYQFNTFSVLLCVNKKIINKGRTEGYDRRVQQKGATGVKEKGKGLRARERGREGGKVIFKYYFLSLYILYIIVFTFVISIFALHVGLLPLYYMNILQKLSIHGSWDLLTLCYSYVYTYIRIYVY